MHGLVRDKTELYMPLYYDDNSQTTSIIIDSFDGITKISMFYKLRDKFNFRVGAGLTIRNI